MAASQDEFPVETTLVCYGLQESPREDIYEKSQELIDSGLGLPNMQVEGAKRLKGYNGKPGVVKITLPTLEAKISALRRKSNLVNTAYRRVYIRSSQSHSDRLMQKNFQTLLKELPCGDMFRMTSAGKLFKNNDQETDARARGPPTDLSHRNAQNSHLSGSNAGD